MSNRSSYDGFVQVNGCRLHYVEQGSGPAIVFCHGFPELAYSWRHQLPAMAAAGYRAIAYDARGHGESDAPTHIEDYSVLHTVGDLIGLLDALSIDRAVVVGHDAGVTAAYYSALMRPDRVHGVAGLSVPFVPRGPMSPFSQLAGQVPEGFYMNYFQRPGLAESDLEQDVLKTMRRLFYANSGEYKTDAPFMMVVGEANSLVDVLPEPAEPMRFVTEQDLSVYVREYSRTGFRGGLNGYRVFDLNWELTEPWHGMPLPVPSLYVGGTADTVLHFPGYRELAEAMGTSKGSAKPLFLVGAGHWIQSERPAEVNSAILDFITTLTD